MSWMAISQHAPPIKHDMHLHGTSSVPSVKCSHMYTVYTCALPYRWCKPRSTAASSIVNVMNSTSPAFLLRSPIPTAFVPHPFNFYLPSSNLSLLLATLARRNARSDWIKWYVIPSFPLYSPNCILQGCAHPGLSTSAPQSWTGVNSLKIIPLIALLASTLYFPFF